MKFKNDIEKFELFESFLKNELPQNKRTDFENELKNNKQLAKEFDEHKIMSELVIDNSLLDLKSDLVSIHNNFNGNSAITPQNKKGFLGNNLITLFIGGIILISGMLLIVKSKKNDFITEVPTRSEQKVEHIALEVKEEKIIQPEQKENSNKQTIKFEKKEIKKDSAKTNIEKEELQIEDAEKQEEEYLPEEKEIEKISTPDKVENPVQTPVVNLVENEPKQEETQKEDNEVVDCEKVMINCEFRSKETCVDDYSGEIIIDRSSFKGGTPPYTVSINGGLDYYSSRYVFNSLKEGIYNLFVKDKNLCEKEIAIITIEEKICNTAYKYSPEFGELWTIPVEKNKEGVFKLFNKNGQIIVEKNINDYSDNTWDGKDDNGVQLVMDYYPFVIQYSDGEVFKGSVTLFK